MAIHADPVVSASNTSRIPYSSMSYLEVFYDYCVSGIDFSLAGNGGKECASFISSSRRLSESLLALTSGAGFVWMGIRMHRTPKRIMSTARHAAVNGRRTGGDGEYAVRAQQSYDPYRYDPVRILLLIAMTFTFALEACYKLATRQLVFIINPCHLLCVIHIILLAVPAKFTALQYLFRIHLNFLHGPIMACLLPVTNTLFLPFEVATYWIEHFLLLIIPVYLLKYSGIYSVEKLLDPSWLFMSYGIWGIYHFVFLDALALTTLANVNSMLCPAISDPFYGPNWRLFGMLHQFALCAVSGKVWGMLGKSEELDDECSDGGTGGGCDTSLQDKND